MNERSSSRYPFTATQWQELEHQALIYKYMVSGIPIPSDLVMPIRRSLLLDSTRFSHSMAFQSQAQLGWSCFQRAEDPEPGRCRRTDGKKWRCSKEAYPDSKYCEKHMHRGKNRSRKPVEISLAAVAHSSSSTSSSSSSSSSVNCPFPLSRTDPFHVPHPYSTASRPSNLRGMQNVEERTYTLSKEEEEERKRPLRRFFDECPEKNKVAWMDMVDESGPRTQTQLSIASSKWF